MKSVLASALLLTSAAAASAETAEDRRLECSTFLIQAADADIIRDVGVRDGTVGVVVDANVWGEMPDAARAEMAEAVNCWVFDGEEGPTAHLQFLDHRDFSVMADWGPAGLENRQ